MPSSAPVRVLVESQPKGATVLLDGVDVGTTPIELARDASRTPVLVRVELDGYRSEEKQVLLDAPRELSFRLRKKGDAGSGTKRTSAPAVDPLDDIKIGR